MHAPTVTDGRVALRQDQFDTRPTRVVERGAVAARTDVGLHSENAAHDMLEGSP